MRRLFRIIARRNNQPGRLCCLRCGEPINDFSDECIVTTIMFCTVAPPS